VASVRQPVERQLVEVADIEALARIAERYDRMILHEQGADADTFAVADDGVLYRYVVAHVREPEPAPAPPVPLAAVPALPDLHAPAKRSA
jgi:hypothetical protein